MGNIVFVNSPYINRNSDIAMPPFAIVKMVNYMKLYKERVKIIDFPVMIKKQYIEEIREDFYQVCANLIFEEKPEVVIFAATNFANFSSTLLIAEKLKAMSDNIKVIFGGPHSTIHAQYIMSKFPFVDYIVLGRNVENTVKLIYSLIEKKTIEDIPSIYGRNAKEKYVVSFTDGDTTNVNIFNNIEYMKEYRTPNNKFHLLLESGYGCGANCLKCTDCFDKGKMVIPELDILLNTMLKLFKQSMVEDIYIYDLFLFPKKDIEKFCKKITEKKIELRWYTRALITAFDEKIFELLQKAGCKELLFSIEKHNIISSKCYKKLLEIFNWSKKYKLNITFCYVIGNEQKEDDLRWLFNTVYENIENPYIHFELSLASPNYWEEKMNKEYKYSTFLMKGIDFLGNEQYLYEDISCIHDHPVIFSNFYLKKENCERNIKIAKCAINLFKYFRRSFNQYAMQLGVDYYDALCLLMQSDCITWEEIISVLGASVTGSQVFVFENKLYSIRVETPDQNCVQYADDLYIFTVDYDIKKKNDEVSFYIIKKESDNIKIYMINQLLYNAILRKVQGVCELEENYKEYMEKYSLL